MLPNWLRLSLLGVFVVLAAIWFVNTWRFHRARQQGRGREFRLRIVIDNSRRSS